VEKEVIVEKRVEIPVEVIKEVIKIEYIEVEKPVEKIVEIIKEVPIERVIENIVEIVKEIPVEKVVLKEVIKEVVVEKVVRVSDDTQVNELLLKIEELENKPPKVLEVIREVPVEKIVEIIKEVQVEVIKEVVVEKESTDIGLKSKLDAIQNTVQKLKLDNIEKDKKIKEYEKTIEDIQKFQTDRKAAFLKGSNLDDTLYK
jgi:hypothetical protein